MKIFKLTSFFLLAVFVMSQSVFAADYMSLQNGTGSKGVYEYKVTPGLVIKDFISFKNLTDHEIVVDVSPVGALLGGEAKRPIDKEVYGSGGWEFLDDAAFVHDSSGQVAAWITLGVSEIQVPANETYKLPFKLSVPEDAEEYMTYFGGIRSSARRDDPEMKETGSILKTALVDKMFIHVLPKERKKEVLAANEGKVVGISVLVVVIIVLAVGFVLTGGGYHLSRRRRRAGKK